MQMMKKEGWIEIICGGMFSGKSEELIRRIRRAKIAKQRVQVFKPAIDNRYHAESIASHNGLMADAKAVQSVKEIIDSIEPTTEIVAIDEVQFFGMEIVDVCQELANRGIRVICAGLDQDFRGQAFGPTPLLLAMSEYVTKLHAICVCCGQPASRTQRLINGVPASIDDPIILVGADEQYEARCRHCHELPQVRINK